MEIEYSSNNSGGSWWLKDEDWKALEAAGWWVEWGGMYFCNSKWDKIPAGKEDCGMGEKCLGHRRAETAEEAEAVRWLGCLAKCAKKDFATVKEALEEFERITGENVSDEGCNCCGAPHSFSWEGGYCSGEDCLQYLYSNVPSNLREAVEMLNNSAA